MSSATITATSVWSGKTQRRLKYMLWIAMALATTSVIFYSEIPLFHQPQERAQLHALRWILIPHAIAGTLAMLVGPSQFSSRIRQRYIRLHRWFGRLYVTSVGVAAPLAVLSTAYSTYPKAVYFKIAISVQAGAWVICTGIALYSVLSHRLSQHREWMVRSYAVTFTFVGTRVLQPVPAWNHLGRFWFAVAIVCITGLAVMVPQIATCLSRVASHFFRYRPDSAN